MRFSNTHLFYEKGWRGINIDATPGSMKEFNKIRKRDINIEAGISDEHGELEYYSFYEPALNSFSKVVSEERINSGWKLKEIIRIKTFPINDILEKHVPKNQQIDFITMDIEGFDLLVFKSLDFEKYAPEFFLLEDIDYMGKDLMEYKTSGIFCFLNQRGYTIVAKTLSTSLFRKTV
ncbi:hypothetical protein FACS189491_01240 [Spirochaetia bacterium]|nr:hypothetical protein FACS189491_01240 [Spirochaetia bacterium]